MKYHSHIALSAIVTIRMTSVILPKFAKHAVFEVLFCLWCTMTYHFGVLTCQVKSRLCIHFKTSLGRPDIFQVTVFPGQRKLPCFIKLTLRDLNIFHLSFFLSYVPYNIYCHCLHFVNISVFYFSILLYI